MLRSRFEERHVVHSRAATVRCLKPCERCCIAKLHPLLVRGRQCSLRQHLLKVSGGANALGRVKKSWLPLLLLGLTSGRLLIVAGRALKQVIVSLLHLFPAWLDNDVDFVMIVIVHHVWSGCSRLIIHRLRLVIKIFLSFPRPEYHVRVVKLREGRLDSVVFASLFLRTLLIDSLAQVWHLMGIGRLRCLLLDLLFKLVFNQVFIVEVLFDRSFKFTTRG